jgi:hypothetical protein
MNRNRDLDGNGTIDPCEIRWYLPTSSIYIQIAIAQGELPDPLIKFKEHSRTEFIDAAKRDNQIGKGNADRWGTYNYHYITSDDQYYWAEQYVNTGNEPWQGYGQDVAACYTVRCVRNLGTDPSQGPVKDQPEVGYAFTHDPETRTFTQTNFTDETLRGYVSGGLAPHDISDAAARMSKKFEYAKNQISGKSDDYISFSGQNISTTSNKSLRSYYWTQSLKINGICGQYTQEDEQADLGTWRVPSAGELALMWIENIPMTDNAHFISGTREYFVNYDLRDSILSQQVYLGYNNDGDRKVPAMDVMDKTFHVRCVRDVE